MEDLIAKARDALKNAYAPYSNFRVGAAVLTKSGRIYTGANVENASYGLTMCAERVAVFKAVTEGDRDIEAVAIVSDAGELVPPCGACRQVIAEFNPNALIIMATADGSKRLVVRLRDLLPMSFSRELLKR
ncbi:cytidine deaminase [Thermoproteus tenax]|uniref:cytidine deaminase n=1 Tax=Thermoproteus tenax (strain ATCC 35583 / DSM 2078 / JCM 9277 / NBRC 100435 / Kra 1) TaxID=768679 RepID=G4RLS9_THETK|nr:cytidine deaminase [Thermoproteus tenax]CCC82524.1 Cytidine deaminase [Thermoproteus tenax Kra 1]